MAFLPAGKKVLIDPYYFLQESFWLSPSLIALFTGTLFLIIFLRFFLLAGLYDWLTRSAARKGSGVVNRQFHREVGWSLIASGIFTALSILTFYGYQRGYTKIYTEIAQYGMLYFLISIATYLVMYETYYYWLHRWMHKPRIFRIVHKVHHESMHTSAFTSFSFHPIEAFLQFIFLPLMVFIMPIHYFALGAILLLMTISAIINHAGVEVYPKRFYRHPIGRWLIGSSHHDLHHKEFKTNYGLYFTFWDRWMRTESNRYAQHFDANRINRSRSQRHRSTDVLHK